MKTVLYNVIDHHDDSNVYDVSVVLDVHAVCAALDESVLIILHRCEYIQ
jgi:hypothetical protein